MNTTQYVCAMQWTFNKCMLLLTWLPSFLDTSWLKTNNIYILIGVAVVFLLCLLLFLLFCFHSYRQKKQGRYLLWPLALVGWWEYCKKDLPPKCALLTILRVPKQQEPGAQAAKEVRSQEWLPCPYSVLCLQPVSNIHLSFALRLSLVTNGLESTQGKECEEKGRGCLVHWEAMGKEDIQEHSRGF